MAALHPSRARVAALALAMALMPLGATQAHAADGSDWHGQWRLRGDAREAGASSLAPPPDSAALELELSGDWRHGALGLSGRVQWQGLHLRGGAHQSQARVDELALTGDHGDWQSTVGRKVVSWDVGQAFRPNDLVQQEARRSLLAAPLQGRALLQLEHFGADASTALVWVNPQHLDDPAEAARGPEESALAARWYGRVADGAADAHLFARIGRHTGTSLGGAMAWVASDALSLHGSLRLLQRHEGWRDEAGDSAVLWTTNPWRIDTLGRSAQALLGASWTGAAQQSLLFEAWWDGSAPSDTQWAARERRTAALSALRAQAGVPAAALAGNLAWQASPLAGVLGAPTLRRENLFLRAAWQPEAWTAALDLWFTPADRGRAVTASLQWQGDRVQLQAALRQQGGPRRSAQAQLPSRRSAAVMASWAF